ncbi:hypothetical protein V2W45_1339764 [Cenococcum geophilum]
MASTPQLESKLECSKCFKTFGKQRALQRHKKAKHLTKRQEMTINKDPAQSERTSAAVTRQTSLSSIHKFTDTPLGKEATESTPNLKRKRKSSEQGDTGSIQGTETRPPSITLGASRKRRPKSRRKRKSKQESRQNRLHPEIVQFVDLNAGGWDYSPLPGWMISRWAFCSGACRWCNNCGEGFNGWI